jgi:hypothetical protein
MTSRQRAFDVVEAMNEGEVPVHRGFQVVHFIVNGPV